MNSTQTHLLKIPFFSLRPVIKSRSLLTSSSQILNETTPGTLDINSLNKMITGFSKSGDLSNAQKLFDQMPEKDVVSWNSIMAAYARNGQFGESLGFFSDMHRSGLALSNTSFSTVITACAKLKALDQGTQIHGLSIKLKSSKNVFVGTSLITMYSNCNVVDVLCWVFDDIECLNVAAWNSLISGYVSNHRICDARECFDQMPNRNVVSWTSMINGYIEVKKMGASLELFNLMPIKNSVTWFVTLGGFVSNAKHEEAIEFFTRMMHDGIQVNAPSIVKVISACSSSRNLNHGRKIHGLVIKLGFRLDPIVAASLVFMYCECLRIEAAKLEFDKMETKSIGSWNSLIHGYINSDRIDEARVLFDAMNSRDNISWNLMVSGYLKSNRTKDALELFIKMPGPTVEATTAVMHNFIRNGKINEAQKLFDTVSRGDAVSYTTLLFGYLNEGQLEKAIELFNQMPEKNVVAFNVMISGFLRHGKVSEAYELFNKCPNKDYITWDAIIAGFVQNGLNEQAIQLYRKMLFADINPSELVISCLLRSSSKLTLLFLGEQLHAVSIKLTLEKFLVVSNSLINMYCKCGEIHIARTIFGRMIAKDVVTWNSIIYGYALHGLGNEAIEMFDSMKKSMGRPDDVTFLGVLSACTHDCLLQEAQYHFTLMSDYGIKPALPHYACMINLFCRMGLIEKAEELVSSMPYEPDSILWTSILSGSKLNGNIELAEYAARQLFAWDPMDKMPYLHLMSVYRSVGKWDDMENLSHMLTKIGSKKQPGCSWI